MKTKSRLKYVSVCLWYVCNYLYCNHMLSGIRPQIKYCLLSVVKRHIITSHFHGGAHSASNCKSSAVSYLIFWGNKLLLRMNYMSPVGLNVYFLYGKAGYTQSARALSVVYKNGSETCEQGVGTRGHEMRDLRMLSWKLKQQRPRRLRKRHLKSDVALL